MASLTAIQGANALYPLLIFPYLFTVLNPGEFAKIVLSESIALYILSVSLYSFDVTGVEEVVLRKEKKGIEEVGEIYWRILLARLVLFLFTSISILIFSYFIFNSYFITLLVWLMYPLGMIFQSNYYYQATETNIKLGLFVIVSRVSASILIYVLIKEAGMGHVSTYVLSGSFLMSGLMSFVYVVCILGVKVSYFQINRIVSDVKEGFLIFSGNFSVSLFRGSNILILSLVSSSVAVSTYSIAEKLIKSLQALTRPLNELAFPKLIKKIKESEKKEYFCVIWDYTKYQIMIMSFVVTICIGGLFLLLHFGLAIKYDFSVVSLMCIMMFAPVFGIANYMFGTAGLNILGFHSYYARTILITGVISVGVSFILSFVLSDTGASISFVVGEALLFCFFYAKCKNISLSS